MWIVIVWVSTISNATSKRNVRAGTLKRIHICLHVCLSMAFSLMHIHSRTRIRTQTHMHTKYRAHITSIVCKSWVMTHEPCVCVFSIHLYRYLTVWLLFIWTSKIIVSSLCLFCFVFSVCFYPILTLTLTFCFWIVSTFFHSLSLSLCHFISANKWKLGNQHKKVLPKKHTENKTDTKIGCQSHVVDKDEWTRDRDTKVWVKWVSCTTLSHTHTQRIQTIAMHIWHIFNGYEMRDEMERIHIHIYSGQLIIIISHRFNLFCTRNEYDRFLLMYCRRELQLDNDIGWYPANMLWRMQFPFLILCCHCRHA